MAKILITVCHNAGLIKILYPAFWRNSKFVILLFHFIVFGFWVNPVITLVNRIVCSKGDKRNFIDGRSSL